MKQQSILGPIDDDDQLREPGTGGPAVIPDLSPDNLQTVGTITSLSPSGEPVMSAQTGLALFGVVLAVIAILSIRG